MRHIFPPVMVLVVLLSGCVRVTQDLTINRDGTGTLDFSYSVKEKDLTRMREVAEKMAAIDPSLAPEDVDWLTAFDEDVIRREWNKSAGEGVALAHVETGLQEGWRTMRALVRFDTLQQLFDCGMIDDCHIALTRGPDGQYGYQQSISVTGMSDSLPPGLQMDNLEPLVSLLLQDFSADIHFRAPGRIIRSNADSVDGSTASWKLRGSDDDFMARLQEFDVRLMFDGRGMSIAEAITL